MCVVAITPRASVISATRARSMAKTVILVCNVVLGPTRMSLGVPRVRSVVSTGTIPSMGQRPVMLVYRAWSTLRPRRSTDTRASTRVCVSVGGIMIRPPAAPPVCQGCSTLRKIELSAPIALRVTTQMGQIPVHVRSVRMLRIPTREVLFVPHVI